jgi:dienelactone hydrolase
MQKTVKRTAERPVAIPAGTVALQGDLAVPDAHLRFDIAMLVSRLVAASDWLASEPATAALALGYFGASTGAGAALVAAAERPDAVRAIVSRGGRPDLAGPRSAA